MGTRRAGWGWLVVGLPVAFGCGFDSSGGSGDGPGAIDGGGAGDPDGGPQGGDGGAPAGFRKKIEVAALGGGDLVDFPLYLELVDADLMARADADGSDIYITGEDGEVLDREVQRWDPGTGRLEAWVRVTLLGGAQTVMYLRYGDPLGAPPPDPPGVWANDFAAVWHLEEAPTGALPDSLGARPGTPSGGMDSADSIAGTLGRAIDLDGGDDMIAFDNPLSGSSAHTISAWVRQESTDDNDALLVVGNGSCQEARWLHTRFDNQTVAVGFYCNDWPDTGVDVQGDDWTLLHWTYAAGESRLYRDGDLAGGPFAHSETPATQGSNGYIGNVPTADGFGANMGLNGAVDEVRIATRVRSAAWIAAEFANQSDPGSFYAVGSEEPL